MSRILLVISSHLAIYMFTQFWWSSLALAIILGFILHKSISSWLQIIVVTLLFLIDSSYAFVVNEGRLANQLIQVFSLNFGPLLILFSGIIGGLSAAIGQWLGRSFRSELRPVQEKK